MRERKRARERQNDSGREKEGVLELGNGSEETLCIGGSGLGWQKEDRVWK